MCIPVLYQLPISHYCEKVRWALDFKRVRYNTVNRARMQVRRVCYFTLLEHKPLCVSYLSQHAIDTALEKIHARLHSNRYLVGDTFTRADLAGSALLAPLCQPDTYPIDWIKPVPAPLGQLQQKLDSQLRFVLDNYLEYRGTRAR